MTRDTPRFSIVTVTLNCVDSIESTVESVRAQTFSDYEYVIKDGGSDDGTLDRVRSLNAGTIVSGPDEGIYDAMNQAARLCRGEYVCFLNAGDAFVHDGVLRLAANYIERFPGVRLFYGDVLSMERHPIYGRGRDDAGRVLIMPERFDRLAAFLISACQQSWFIGRELCLKHPFDLSFRLKADHEFFWFWLLRERIPSCHIPEVLVRYAGGGQSETRRELLRQEHERLLRRYYSPAERLAFGLVQRIRQAYRVVNYTARGRYPAN
jgi:glycosyltransferase involved in cell wall biosynthesis